MERVQSYLFVYGTLRLGEDTEFAYRLSSESRFAGAARVQGQLYLVAHYPGLVRSGDGWVRGDLFGDVSAELLRELDAYEGSDYRRETIEVEKADGEKTQAWVYVYAEPLDGCREIVSGDWRHREYLRNLDSEPEA